MSYYYYRDTRDILLLSISPLSILLPCTLILIRRLSSGPLARATYRSHHQIHLRTITRMYVIAPMVYIIHSMNECSTTEKMKFHIDELHTWAACLICTNDSLLLGNEVEDFSQPVFSMKVKPISINTCGNQPSRRQCYYIFIYIIHEDNGDRYYTCTKSERRITPVPEESNFRKIASTSIPLYVFWIGIF